MMPKHLRSWIYFLLVVTLSSVGVNGDYIFKIMFHSYANPDNLKANGSPCDGEQKCESFLHYCLEGSTSCSQESYQNYNITGGDPSPNPVLFPMSGSWPGQFELYMRITDDDNDDPRFGDERIDRFPLPVIFLSPSPVFTNPMTFVGDDGRANITLSFQVECATDFYGLDCATFCQYTDNENGHYSCNGDGTKMCLTGYQNPQSDCTEAICLPACKNGNCVSPGMCQCDTGWSGDTCSDAICTVSCNLREECVSPEVCECMDGWSGNDCIVPVCTGNCNSNAGLCVAPEECLCGAGWTGDTCNSPICANNCNSNGECVSPGVCQCSDGSLGGTCTLLTCNQDCGPNGYCASPGVCECNDGWSGDTCADPICDQDCSPNSYCASPGVCQCNDGWSGDNCDIPVCVVGCNSTNGYCNSPGDCICYEGWNGTLCNQCVPADGCSVVGGYCSSPGECVCQDGYTGVNCESGTVAASTTPQTSGADDLFVVIGVLSAFIAIGLAVAVVVIALVVAVFVRKMKRCRTAVLHAENLTYRKDDKVESTLNFELNPAYTGVNSKFMRPVATPTPEVEDHIYTSINELNGHKLQTSVGSIDHDSQHMHRDSAVDDYSYVADNFIRVSIKK